MAKASHIEALPEPVLDHLLAVIFQLCPSLRLAFLASLGSTIHHSAIRALFTTVQLPDDNALLDPSNCPSNSIACTLHRNPTRYASYVRRIVICAVPVICGRNERVSLYLEDQTDIPVTPIHASTLTSLLQLCGDVEEFIWESTLPPSDGICETLVLHHARLTRFAHNPRFLTQSHRRSSVLKWNALSLPLLGSLNITSLHISHLSQPGARAFSTLLKSMGESSSLESLKADFVWLDDPLCEAIVEAGRRLRKLTLSTTGTKLTDRGIASILEGCDVLQELKLDEVQGRLSRSLWTKPISFPPKLRRIDVIFSEAGPHHSWTADHIYSIASVPLERLETLSILRREALPTLHNGVPSYLTVADEILSLKHVPSDFMKKMKNAKSMKVFHCDFWSFSLADVKGLLESCTTIESLKLCLDAPFVKLLAMTSAFASLSTLRTLSISVSPAHAPGQAPSPVPPYSSHLPPTPPSESPVLKSKAILPQLMDFEHMQNQTCLGKLDLVDPSMPLLRDIKRFVRKCPRLQAVEWYGKAGRGSWHVKRLATISKISTNAIVEYCAPEISPPVWDAMVSIQQQERTGYVSTDRPREGHEWTGPQADALISELSSSQGPRDATTGRNKKDRAPSVSTSSSSSGDLFTPSMPKTSPSPVQVFTPLTPPHSEMSFCSSGQLDTSCDDGSYSPVVGPPASRQPTYTTLGRTRSSTGTKSNNHTQQVPRPRRNTDTDSRSSAAWRRGKGRGRGKPIRSADETPVVTHISARGKGDNVAKTPTCATGSERGRYRA